ncbi:hypothetical protein PsorP6_010194 [Peronosclerospora sorghi]|uniref:Uncharacterized protein n=1 Tax=Peronosclerospora sorghi TaxID=230839 RepID=A0ACC0VVD6_9STRA|nr:hypothetical protein PsorP6_010194 [Peronosclerospora sorghi]
MTLHFVVKLKNGPDLTDRGRAQYFIGKTRQYDMLMIVLENEFLYFFVFMEQHEMIHAYVFVATPVRDDEDHGPLFQQHMHRINNAAQTRITVFHTFHDEVDSYRQHVWQCNGPCRRSPPYFGLVKRSMNRAPGPTDRWWAEHVKTCGGSYSKIKETADFTAKKMKKRKLELAREEKQRKKDMEAKIAPSLNPFFLTKENSADDNKTQNNTKPKTL